MTIPRKRWLERGEPDVSSTVFRPADRILLSSGRNTRALQVPAEWPLRIRRPHHTIEVLPQYEIHDVRTFAYQGDILTFVPETNKFTSEDSCVAKNNYQKPTGMNCETYRWRVERDEYGVKMCLAGEGVNGCAYKR